MAFPTFAEFFIDNQSIQIPAFNSANTDQSLNQQPVNIFASGPSIAAVEFDGDLLSQPALFVNGSLSLLAEHEFSNIAGYVIRDLLSIKRTS